MILKLGERELQINTTLGVCYKIEKAFDRKKYMQVFQEVKDMGIEDQLKLLHCGVKESEGVSFSDFKDLVSGDENFGLNDLFENIMRFVNQLQYPGLSEDEIEKKQQEKAQRAKEMGIGSET